MEGGLPKEWGEGLDGLKQLIAVLEEDPNDSDLVKGAREFYERLQKIVKKLNSKLKQLLEFEPIRQSVVAIRRACEGAIAYVRGGDVNMVSRQVKCRVLIGKCFDLLEVVVESHVKRGEKDISAIFTTILSKTKQPEKVQQYMSWWQDAFGGKLVVPYDEFFHSYTLKYLAESVDRDSVHEAVKACVDYSNDGTVTVYEYAFFCLWWFPAAYAPKALILLLKQGCFQHQYDRKCYSLALKTPGDYFIRTTVNQGGGWCVSFLDPYLKARHVLLSMRTEDTPGWVLPCSTTKEQSACTSILGLLLKNSDILQIPKGNTFTLPNVDWDDTHAAGDDDL